MKNVDVSVERKRGRNTFYSCLYENKLPQPIYLLALWAVSTA